MTDAVQPLRDDEARRNAIVAHDRSLLVEAGAGSGKTAVMAGRIAAMLAEGVAPSSIAAVTFTELAASELLIRVRDVVSTLAAGEMPHELRIAFPDGLTDEQKGHMALAYRAISDLTCSTIHGFCQRLIKPYPVEADIDPGASILDRNQGDLAFIEIVDAWLREELAGDQGGLLAELVVQYPTQTVALVHKIADNLRRRRTVTAPPAPPLAPNVLAFRQAVSELNAFIAGAGAAEPETMAIAGHFADMEAVIDDATVETAVGLVQLLVLKPHRDMTTASGSFSAYRKKTKWTEAAKRQGLSKADGERLSAEAEERYRRCCNAWIELLEAASGTVLAALIGQIQPILDQFRNYKRAAALLDFDDLIFAARDLLRDHDDVRRVLADRFSRVLVDEFQDTDPLQAEIFWRLCGEPPAAADAAAPDWPSFEIRPGALFLVGDPKQAIYRFRGADVAAYIRARETFEGRADDSVLSISTNFRSCAPILNYVNSRFEAVLSSEGQPGYTALDAFHPDPGDTVCVAALDVRAADAEGKASSDGQRDAEAEAVADMCARLIGSQMILDRRAGDRRLCRPGDIALLAPTGSELWRYEEALERRGIPVATQAGKGLFRRQEIQDLIAITRVLADRRDGLALIALLRGPLVGLSEEELLDIIWALPRDEARPDQLPRLNLGVDADLIDQPVAQSVIKALQSLGRRIHSTTPHDLLSQAVDVLRVRPLLLQRHEGQAERALANVDLYLSLATVYGVRGLRAFADTMTTAWTDPETRAVEGRPDAQEEAVALYTMHAAKGLEWPIVVPINTMTRVIATDNAVTDRASDVFYCPILGVKPAGFEAARDAEKAELDRERVRLWYVAATRARELLVLPRLDVAAASTAWISLVDLSQADLPALDLGHLPTELGEGRAIEPNLQTREIFAGEAATIAAASHSLKWMAPSRDESPQGPLLVPEVAEIWSAPDGAQPQEDVPVGPIQGGRERGLILHKLLEEVLTGEVAEDQESLMVRGQELIASIGQESNVDAAVGLSPDELAGCVSRTLALPEIAALRPTLASEFPVYASARDEEGERVTTGFADAISFGADGEAEVVIDWKSDVNPAPETIDHYVQQVRSYLGMTGTPRGLIVMVTSGQVVRVTLPTA